MQKVILFFAVLILAGACSPSTKVQGNSFGEAVKVKKSLMTYDELLTKLKTTEKFDDIQVEGTVSEVCQAKGCWMTIISADASKETMMVKFKDYGFFMPKDISGKTVIMQGKAFKEVTPVDELRHYAEDAGKSEEEIAAITEPKTELKFEANGVIIKE